MSLFTNRLTFCSRKLIRARQTVLYGLWFWPLNKSKAPQSSLSQSESLSALYQTSNQFSSLFLISGKHSEKFWFLFLKRIDVWKIFGSKTDSIGNSCCPPITFNFIFSFHQCHTIVLLYHLFCMKRCKSR